jgi:hypothetical protein
MEDLADCGELGPNSTTHPDNILLADSGLKSMMIILRIILESLRLH